MGARLAELLGTGLDGQDGDRDSVLAGLAQKVHLRKDAIEEIAAGGQFGPDEDTLRRLVESVGVDADQALAAAREDGVVLEGDEVPSHGALVEAFPLRLTEAADQSQAAPGTRRYEVVVIRPGEGKGFGNRIYTSRMLESNAANFGGQSIFFNHEDLETILKRGHGSRDPRDLAGWLNEATWFDGNYAEPGDAAEGWEKGAVKGYADFLIEAADYIDRLPKALRLSIDMAPTKLRARRRKDGKMGALVEGVVKGSGSLDLITGKAGAGGKVLQRLRESAQARYVPGHEAERDEDALTDDQLLEAVRGRPDLLDQLREEPEVAVNENVERLVEALGTEDGQQALALAMSGDGALAESIDRLVEAKVEVAITDREDAIREDARAEGRRDADLRDFRDEARRLVEASPIAQFQRTRDDLLGRFAIRPDGSPTPELDVHAEIEDGQVTKSALERLRESVADAIELETNKLREAGVTQVRGLGPAPETPPEGEGKGGEEEKREDPMADRFGLDPEKVREHQVAG